MSTMPAVPSPALGTRETLDRGRLCAPVAVAHWWMPATLTPKDATWTTPQTPMRTPPNTANTPPRPLPNRQSSSWHRLLKAFPAKEKTVPAIRNGAPGTKNPGCLPPAAIRMLSDGPEMWPDLLPLAVPLACHAHASRMTLGAGVRGLRDGVLCRYQVRVGSSPAGRCLCWRVPVVSCRRLLKEQGARIASRCLAVILGSERASRVMMSLFFQAVLSIPCIVSAFCISRRYAMLRSRF